MAAGTPDGHRKRKTMKTPALRTSRRILNALREKARANSTIRSLLYDSANRGAFGGIAFQEVMLTDRTRVDAYAEGIRRIVKPGDVVIDLGTGTGILAMIAARQGPKRIYAIEHGPIIEIARQAAAHNGVNCITFINENSRQFDPPELADLIIHEQIGDYLFEENLLENLLDLKARALKPSGQIFPSRFDLFLEPCRMKADHAVPFAWEEPIQGFDFSFLREQDLIAKGNTRQRRKIPAGSVEAFLCDRQPLLSVDLNAISAPSEVPRQVTVKKKVVESGMIDAISIYFRVYLDDDLSILNAPDSLNTSWDQPVFRIPRREVAEGEVLALRFEADQIADPSTWKITLD